MRLSDRTWMNTPDQLDETQKTYFRQDAAQVANRIANQYPGQWGFLEEVVRALATLAMNAKGKPNV